MMLLILGAVAVVGLAYGLGYLAGRQWVAAEMIRAERRGFESGARRMKVDRVTADVPGKGTIVIPEGVVSLDGTDGTDAMREATDSMKEATDSMKEATDSMKEATTNGTKVRPADVARFEMMAAARRWEGGGR
jgi:hypothetical protein